MKTNFSNKGALMLEILIVVFIVGIAIIAFLDLATFSLRMNNVIKMNSAADDFAKEAVEAARNFRDGTDWDANGIAALTMGAIYHPEKTADNPPKWSMVSGEETIGAFKRKIVFQNGLRDGGGNIVESGGVIDNDTKKMIVTVTFQNHSVEIITYFTNWK